MNFTLKNLLILDIFEFLDVNILFSIPRIVVTNLILKLTLVYFWVKAYKIFNKRTLVLKESMNVIFDESNIALHKNVTFMNDDLTFPHCRSSSSNRGRLHRQYTISHLISSREMHMFQHKFKKV